MRTAAPNSSGPSYPASNRATNMPPAPTPIFAPVGDPLAKPNDDARERLARTRDALREANDRLGAGRAWYEGARQSYGGEGAK
jgi:hypothetical protein